MTVEAQETFICEDCGSEQSVEFESDMHSICEDCFKNYVECSDCSDYVRKDETQNIRTLDRWETICDSCLDNYRRCIECDVWIHEEDRDLREFNGDIYCNDCYTDIFGECEICGRISQRDDMFGDLCEECHEERGCGGLIHDYGFKPMPIFQGEHPYFGVELEVEGYMRSREAAEKVVEIGESDRVYLKEDGSLPDHGFEIVTHPFSLDYHKNNFPWEKITSNLRKMGVRSHDTSTCGLHIHMSKDGLSKVEKIKIGALIHSQERLFKKIARRNSHYGRIKDKKRGLTESKSAALHCDGGCCVERDSAVNYTPPKTIEFRLFKGTLNYNTLMARIECCHAVRQFVKECNIGINKIYNDQEYTRSKFLKFIEDNKKVYEFLFDFLYQRDFYTEQEVEDSDEEQMN